MINLFLTLTEDLTAHYDALVDFFSKSYGYIIAILGSGLSIPALIRMGANLISGSSAKNLFNTNKALIGGLDLKYNEVNDKLKIAIDTLVLLNSNIAELKNTLDTAKQKKDALVTKYQTGIEIVETKTEEIAEKINTIADIIETNNINDIAI